MRVGYTRVTATDEQEQISALVAAGCKPDHIHTDPASATTRARAGLDRALSTLRAGDTLVVPTLDRLAPSTKQLAELVDTLQSRRVDLCVVDDAIDTAAPGRQAIFQTFGALTRFWSKEQTSASRASPRPRGREGGKKERLSDEQQADLVRSYQLGTAVAELCEKFGIARGTAYRYLNKHSVVSSIETQKKGRAKHRAA